MRKTKIVATMGPATDTPGILRSMIESGVNVIRVNMSHGDYDTHKKRLDFLKALRNELGVPIPTILDTKGPEIRTGVFPERVTLTAGQKFTLTTRQIDGDKNGCAISHKGLPKDIVAGQRLLIDDGLIELQADKITDTEISCTVLDGGPVSSYKGVNVPGIHLSLPYLSDKDKADLRFGKDQDFDYVAASFVRSAEDLRLIRREIESLGWQDVRIIAKIENAEGVSNIDEIIKESDGIMIARGDLGVEIPLQEIPSIQKHIIKKAVSAGRQVITATQMLESMISHPRPTRAETTDVANAVYDGTSAIMLSGETAAGKYPIEAVRTMATIAERTESDIHYANRFHNFVEAGTTDISTAISHATVGIGLDMNAAALVSATKSGESVRLISRYRPVQPIIGCTPKIKVWRQMNLSWGVTPLLIYEVSSTDELIDAIVQATVSSNLVKKDDKIVISAGVPVGVSGKTNMIKVQVI